MAWADDLPRIRAENEAWRQEYVPRLRAREADKQERRALGKAVMATLPEEQRQAIEAAYGGPL